MISRAEEGLTGFIQLDVRTKHISDWTMLDELSDTPCAREICIGVLNQKSSG